MDSSKQPHQFLNILSMSLELVYRGVITLNKVNLFLLILLKLEVSSAIF